MSLIEHINNCDLENVKEYLKNNPEYDIHMENDEIFRFSCTSGHLEISKWIYELDGKIDIHADNEYVFRWSCAYNHLEVAKWSYSLDGWINIYVLREVFVKSCEDGYLELAKWIYGLDEEYYMKYLKDNEDKIFNDIKEFVKKE